MSKYGQKKVVGAIYDNGPMDNPFLAAMPEMLSADEYQRLIRSLPPLPSRLFALSSEERRRQMPILSSLFVPMNFMYRVYDTLYRAITATYMTRTELEGIRQINALFYGSGLYNYATQADTGSALGVAGHW